MRRIAVTGLLARTLVAVPARGLAIEPVVDTTVAEIISMRSGLDGEAVAFEGEVISEILTGGDGHAWVNVLSEGAAIGVWMPVELAAHIEYFGRYSHTGDIVRVTGTLNEGCDDHGGDLDIHGTGLEVLARGERREQPQDWWKLGVGLAGLAVAYAGWRRMRRIEEATER
jgi:hypothetical protein